MAQAILASMGKFFFQFGLVVFIGATLYGLVMMAYGVPVPGPLGVMSRLLPIIGAASVILGVFGMVSAGVRVLFPQVGQLAGVATYLSLFMPAVTGVATIFTTLISLLPLPGGVVVALTGFASSIIAMTIAYYLAVKVGYLPPE